MMQAILLSTSRKYGMNKKPEPAEHKKMNMKKHLNGFLLGVSITLLLAFKGTNFTPNASTAEVNKIEDFYVFTDSKPVMPFDSLGAIELGFVTDTQYESIRNSLIKKSRNKFPNANGLIMKFDKKGVDKCTVIRIN